MKVLNLRCTHDHTFEGWFGSEADYQSQQTRGLVECPVCGDPTVEKMPSAPHISLSRSRDPAEPAPAAAARRPATPEALTMQAMWHRAVQHVLETTDDVGERFAEEARRMHYGEAEERGIRGQATAEDRLALQDEGIDVVSFPLPDKTDGTLQ